jgi:hypothetical protein
MKFLCAAQPWRCSPAHRVFDGLTEKPQAWFMAAAP